MYSLSALLTAGVQVSNQHVHDYWHSWGVDLTGNLLGLDSQSVGVLAAEELDVDGALGVGSRVLPLDDVGLASRELLVLVGGVDLVEALGGIDADSDGGGGKGQDGSEGEAHIVWLVGWFFVGREDGFGKREGRTGEVRGIKYRTVFKE